jgi:hypothetical protein
MLGGTAGGVAPPAVPYVIRIVCPSFVIRLSE